MLEVGSIIAGKLRIERILGQGGMGIVAEATHLQLDQRVAVKVMRDQLANDDSTVERFMREARAAAKLRSEHVCRVTDVGQLPSGAPYIVMELLEGSDLAVLVQRQPLTIATAVDHVLQACIAIGEAHVHGIVHRDLKPANLFLTKQLGGAPLVKVLDFGIAKAPSATDTNLTQTASVMGSPGYMSPEQLRSSRDVDARTDIWALGVILYQLVSSRLPFPAESVTELAVKVSMDPPDPLVDVDPAFAAVVMRCLEKSPGARFANVPALAAALAPFGSDSARRSLAVIEQLRPRAPADAIASTLPAGSNMAVLDRTAPGTEAPLSTLQGAAGYTVVAPTAVSMNAPRRRVSPLAIAIGGIAIVGLAAGAYALRSSSDKQPVARSARETPGAPPAVAAVAVATGSATSSIPELVARFDHAVARGYCREAARIAEEIKAAGGPADIPPRLNVCLMRQGDAFSTPSAPGSVDALMAMSRELIEEGFAKDARGILDIMLRADQTNMAVRSLALQAACIQGDASGARGYAAKLTGSTRAEADAVCTKYEIDLAAPAATAKASRVAPVEVPTVVSAKAATPPPAPKEPGADWKMDAGYAMMQGNYGDARDIAIAVLRRDPTDKHAAYIATGAYCGLEDAVNARKWAAKLDDAQRKKAQRFGCDAVKIDLLAK